MIDIEVVGWLIACRKSSRGKAEECSGVSAAATRSSKGSRSEARASGSHASAPGVFVPIRQTNVGKGRCDAPLTPRVEGARTAFMPADAKAGAPSIPIGTASLHVDSGRHQSAGESHPSGEVQAAADGLGGEFLGLASSCAHERTGSDQGVKGVALERHRHQDRAKVPRVSVPPFAKPMSARVAATLL